jgi:hypothetical protein
VSVTQKERMWNADTEEMPAPGRHRHPSYRGPSTPRSRSATAAIAGTAVVAILAVLVVVLSYRVGHRNTSVSSGDLSEVKARIDELSGRVNGLQATVRNVARQANASRGKTAQKTQTKSDPQLATCLTQLQREVDDLQAYLAYRTPPRRDRVSGACLTLLQPRFKG